MSTTQHPPIQHPTTDQEFLLSAGMTIHPTQYKTLDSPPSFLSIYARPTLTYRSWARLWGTNTSSILEEISLWYPAASCDFIGFARGRGRFLEFCGVVDGRFGGGGDDWEGRGEGERRMGVVGREMMEGAWIKVLVGLFEEMRRKRDVMRGYVGKRVGGVRGEEVEGRILMTIKEVEGEMKELLRMAVEQRFEKEVKEYWARKWEIYKDRYPNLDVKCITDWSVEAPFQKSLLKPGDVNEDDYVEDEDEVEAEVEVEVEVAVEVEDEVQIEVGEDDDTKKLNGNHSRR